MAEDNPETTENILSIENEPKPQTASPVLTINLYSWATPIIGLVMLIVGIFGGFYIRQAIGASNSTKTPAVVNQAESSATQPAEASTGNEDLMAAVVAQTRHFLGSPDAPVTMIELSDFKCPYCRRFSTDTARQIIETYVTTGQVRVGYLHMAFLSPDSKLAAEASECAADQNAFWEFHDLIFDRGDVSLTSDVLSSYAVELSLDTTAFTECLDSGKYKSTVEADLEFARSIGAQSTPSFVINGQPMIGAQPFSAFQQVIESELTAENP